MTKGTEEVASGYELAYRAGCSLDEILTKSKEMGKEIEQISAATKKLSNMSTEMVKLSDNISAIAEENTAITESMDETVKQVSKSVQEVRRIGGKQRLNRGRCPRPPSRSALSHTKWWSRVLRSEPCPANSKSFYLPISCRKATERYK